MLAPAAKAAQELLEQFPFLPTPVITRWNSTLRLMQSIKTKIRPICQDAVTLNRVLAVEAALPILEPFAIATDIAQSNHATLWDQMLILQLVPAATLPAVRKKQLVTDPIALLAYFMPNANRLKIGIRLLDKLRVVVSALRTLAEFSHPAESLQSSVEHEWHQFRLAPPAGLPGEIGHQQFELWWVTHSARFPRLAFIATALARACPSEACVERVFSKMKLGVGRLRTNIKHEALEAQLIINSALAFDAVGTGGSKVINIDEHKLQDVTVTWILAEAEPPAPVRAAGVKTRRADDICGGCERYFEAHGAEKSLQCDGVCKKWYALECVGIALHLFPIIKALPQWLCPKCSAGYAADWQRDTK